MFVEVFVFFINIVYLFLAFLGLRGCVQAVCSGRERGLLLMPCLGSSFPWLVLPRSTGSRPLGFRSCSTCAQLPRGM